MLFGKKYKKVLVVEGMHCGHCAKKVEDVLKELNGVKNVKVNLEKKEVLVVSKVELSNDLITSAIKKTGFELKEIK